MMRSRDIVIVRKTHAAMKSELLHIRTEVSDVQTNGSNDGEHRRRHVGGGVVEALNNPIELSERVYSDSYEIIIDYWSMWGVV